MSLAPGTKLGPYEIVAPLGAGGMGEVYRAKDTRLDRSVAIKILPAQFSADPVRKQRFQREAKTISSLNHPHICVLYDVGHQDGTDYLVMECVEGETLAKRLEKGPLPLEQVLKYGAQIADALDKAHRSGVVHRDLKPGNIMLTPSGAKLLDFGLAKPAAPVLTGATLTAATPCSPMTEQGTIVGTFQYMSPEQVEGKELDGRSDIFSLGSVLYEIVTGKKAFEGKSQLSVASAVLEKEPTPISSVKPMTPSVLDHAVKKCLAKLPDDRWQSASDLASELKWIGESDGQAAGTALLRNATKGREKIAWLIASALAILLVVTTIRRVARAPALAIFSEIGPPANSRFNYEGVLPCVISPDGRILAFRATDANGTTMLWVRPLESAGARPLPGTEGATDPFWSADSRSLGFFADNKLKTIEVSGGSPVTLADAPGELGGTWNQDGTILFVPEPAKGIYEVSATGGTPAPVIALDASKFVHYELGKFLPDGRHFLYTAELPGPAVAGTYFASLDGKERRLVLKDGGALYASGYILYVRGSTLMAQAFDPERGQFKGDPQLVAQNVSASLTYGRFDISENGILIYQTSAGREKRLTWFNRAGKGLGVPSEGADYFDVRISPGGEKLAFNAAYPAGSQNSEIWVEELARGARMRLTIDPMTDHGIPVWSPDNSMIIFAALQGRSRLGIYRKPANGASNEELLLPSENSDTQIWPTSWSRDGRFILYARGSITDQADIWVLPMAGDRRPRLFVHAPAAAYDGQFSPNARWVAYTSKESGKEEIYVVPFDAARVLNAGSDSPGATASGKWLISPSGGRCPRWRRDGKEIFYLSVDNQMMAVEVQERGDGIEVRPAQALFKAGIPLLPVVSFSPYDVTQDGKKFVITTVSGQDTPLTLVVNWTANLKHQ
jgi:Tol biopolymer transport system component